MGIIVWKCNTVEYQRWNIGFHEENSSLILRVSTLKDVVATEVEIIDVASEIS